MDFCPKLKKRIRVLKRTMLPDNPLVSVIMTFYNEEQNIKKSLTSLKNQIYKNFEIILVNDKSTDGTVGVVDEFFKENPELKYKLIENEVNCGTYKSKNNALEKCEGDLVTYLDADDEFLPQKILKEIKILKKTNKKAIFTFFKRKEDTVKSMRLYSSPLIFRQVYKTVGNFIDNRFGGDSEYWQRLKTIIPEFIIEKRVIFYKAYYCDNKNHLTDIHKLKERRKFKGYYLKCHKEMMKRPDYMFNHKYCSQ